LFCSFDPPSPPSCWGSESMYVCMLPNNMIRLMTTTMCQTASLNLNCYF
jgi:hypothetical protein